MCISKIKLNSLFLLLTALAIGCASVNYVGKSFEPTTDVDVYFSEKEIKTEFTIVGHAIGSGGVSNDKIQDKLIEEARNKGADAILITGVGKSRSPISGSGSIIVSEKQINASFLKYK